MPALGHKLSLFLVLTYDKIYDKKSYKSATRELRGINVLVELYISDISTRKIVLIFGTTLGSMRIILYFCSHNNMRMKFGIR